MMKYALNHSNKFLNYTKAFEMGMIQCLKTLAVETISLIIIYTSTTVQNVVFNFIGLVIIDQFDVMIYDALRNKTFKTCLEPDN